MRHAVAATVIVGIAIGSTSATWANDVSSVQVTIAMRACEEADRASGADKLHTLELIDGGVRAAEAAVAADPKDARAHLALFCNLEKQSALAGLSWRVFARLQRAKAVIDRAHQLAPKDPDVLTAKGGFIHRLPSVLGGDRAAGLVLLRQAVALDPDHVGARLALARAMAEDGAPDARAKAYEALAVAKKLGAKREQSEAANLLANMSQ
jgi:cytochrome c-type biogenesis protein CcmH/NrfG